MKKRRFLLVLIISSLFTFFLGVILTEQEYFKICRKEYLYQYGEVGNISNPPRIGCLDPLGDVVGQPLGMMSLSLFIVSVFLFFTKPEVFKTWSKFALITIPLIILWIINTPVQCGGGYVAMCLTKEMVSIFSAVGFLGISLGIIAYKSFTLRTKNNVEMGK